MIKLLIEILILGIFCNGLKIASEEGMIFYRPAKWVMIKLPEWLSKPIIACIYCMSSIWGVVVHVFFTAIFSVSIYTLPLVIVCGVFVNGFIRLVYEILLEHWNKLKKPTNEYY